MALALLGLAGLAWVQRRGAQAPSLAQQRPASGSRRDVGSQSEAPGRVSAARSLSQVLKQGAVVCFRDARGQTAIAQPQGTGRTWQLAVTCASGGCVQLSNGLTQLVNACSDAVFLVSQHRGNSFSFCSLGGESRYLAASRGLNDPLLLVQSASPAAKWQLSSSGLVNQAHGHKRLPFSVHELLVVPQESIAAAEHAYNDAIARTSAQVAEAQAVVRSLDRDVQLLGHELSCAKADHAAQAQQLSEELEAAQQSSRELALDAHQRCKELAGLEACVDELRGVCETFEAELDAAYREVAGLQGQLAEQEAALQSQQAATQQAVARELSAQQRALDDAQQAHRSDARRWSDTRAALESSLLAKDEEVAALLLQAQRMGRALQTVDSMLHGSARRQRLDAVDRQSLDLVSVRQLTQAAEAQQQGSGMCAVDESTEALRSLLDPASCLGVAHEELLAAAPLPVGAGDECEAEDEAGRDQTSPSKERQPLDTALLVQPAARSGNVDQGHRRQQSGWPALPRPPKASSWQRAAGISSTRAGQLLATASWQTRTSGRTSGSSG